MNQSNKSKEPQNKRIYEHSSKDSESGSQEILDNKTKSINSSTSQISINDTDEDSSFHPKNTKLTERVKDTQRQGEYTGGNGFDLCKSQDEDFEDKLESHKESTIKMLGKTKSQSSFKRSNIRYEEMAGGFNQMSPKRRQRKTREVVAKEMIRHSSSINFSQNFSVNSKGLLRSVNNSMSQKKFLLNKEEEIKKHEMEKIKINKDFSYDKKYYKKEIFKNLDDDLIHKLQNKDKTRSKVNDKRLKTKGDRVKKAGAKSKPSKNINLINEKKITLNKTFRTTKSMRTSRNNLSTKANLTGSSLRHSIHSKDNSHNFDFPRKAEQIHNSSRFTIKRPSFPNHNNHNNHNNNHNNRLEKLKNSMKPHTENDSDFNLNKNLILNSIAFSESIGLSTPKKVKPSERHHNNLNFSLSTAFKSSKKKPDESLYVKTPMSNTSSTTKIKYNLDYETNQILSTENKNKIEIPKMEKDKLLSDAKPNGLKTPNFGNSEAKHKFTKPSVNSSSKKKYRMDKRKLSMKPEYVDDSKNLLLMEETREFMNPEDESLLMDKQCNDEDFLGSGFKLTQSKDVNEYPVMVEVSDLDEKDINLPMISRHNVNNYDEVDIGVNTPKSDHNLRSPDMEYNSYVGKSDSENDKYKSEKSNDTKRSVMTFKNDAKSENEKSVQALSKNWDIQDNKSFSIQSNFIKKVTNERLSTQCDTTPGVKGMERVNVLEGRYLSTNDFSVINQTPNSGNENGIESDVIISNYDPNSCSINSNSHNEDVSNTYAEDEKADHFDMEVLKINKITFENKNQNVFENSEIEESKIQMTKTEEISINDSSSEEEEVIAPEHKQEDSLELIKQVLKEKNNFNNLKKNEELDEVEEEIREEGSYENLSEEHKEEGFKEDSIKEESEDAKSNHVMANFTLGESRQNQFLEPIENKFERNEKRVDNGHQKFSDRKSYFTEEVYSEAYSLEGEESFEEENSADLLFQKINGNRFSNNKPKTSSTHLKI
jgi:hypothetical protein